LQTVTRCVFGIAGDFIFFFSGLAKPPQICYNKYDIIRRAFALPAGGLIVSYGRQNSDY
jgi:hypothetical protein